MKEKETCDPCERDFIESVDQIVDEVDDYSEKDHREKKAEVEEAFSAEGERKSGSGDGPCTGNR